MSKPKKPGFRVHPDVMAWRKWISSPEGHDCAIGGASGQYLENRLWRAFMAGRKRERGSK